MHGCPYMCGFSGPASPVEYVSKLGMRPVFRNGPFGWFRPEHPSAAVQKEGGGIGRGMTVTSSIRLGPSRSDYISAGQTRIEIFYPWVRRDLFPRRRGLDELFGVTKGAGRECVNERFAKG